MPVTERINRDVNTIMQNPEVIARLAELGIYPYTGDIASARSFVEDQRKLMKNVVTELGLQAQWNTRSMNDDTAMLHVVGRAPEKRIPAASANQCSLSSAMRYDRSWPVASKIARRLRENQ